LRILEKSSFKRRVAMDHLDGIKERNCLARMTRFLKQSACIPFLIGILDSWNWRNFGGHAQDEYGIS
jgi:hypothetical protein